MTEKLDVTVGAFRVQCMASAEGDPHDPVAQWCMQPGDLWVTTNVHIGGEGGGTVGRVVGFDERVRLAAAIAPANFLHELLEAGPKLIELEEKAHGLREEITRLQALADFYRKPARWTLGATLPGDP